MKNNYWNDKHEQLCKQWLSASTQVQYSHIHDLLLPALNHMAERIMNRYFAIPSQRQTELKRDAVQEVFLNLHKYNPDKSSSGSYNFCGMIIKHYLYDILVNKPSWIKNKPNQFVCIDSYDEYVLPLEYPESEFNYDILIEYIDIKMLKLMREFEAKKKIRGNRCQYTSYEHKLEILRLCKEFVDKFQCFNGAIVVDYIFINQTKKDVKKNSIVRYFRELFELSPNLNFNLEGREDRIRNSDERYNYVQDDVVPSVNVYHRRLNLKNLNKKYPELQSYQYY